MTRSLLAALAALLVLPSAAAAATADADVRVRGGVPVGPVTFQSEPGETNRVTISEAPGGGVLFRDAANPVRARGDCEQVDRNAARCPFSEDFAKARLGDGDDRATVSYDLAEVFGGPGGDTLTGGRPRNELDGGPGGDTIRGGRGDDELTGGPGRDRLFGEGGDDTLIDGETDAQAARDVIDGGRSVDSAGNDKGDALDYTRRRRGLRVDLERGRTNTEDRFSGIESVLGGRGNDRLSGDRDENWLEGRGGDDVIDGRGGGDIPQGGEGEDRVEGGDGDDTVWGDEGRDALSGGRGDDFVISLEEQGPASADELECGTGDDDARSDARDTLTRACERVVAFSNGLSVRTLPRIAGDTARFRLTCFGGSVDGCHGTLTLQSTVGEAFGSVHFDVGNDVENAPVTVPLTAAAVEALAGGTVVRVDLLPDAPSDLEEPGGYRVFMRRAT